MNGTWLVEGELRGDVVRLDEALSFWGGFDAATGRIIDQSHPQHGTSLVGKIVAMPGSRGSSGTPGVLGDAIRQGTGPAAMIITKADINLVAGALTAQALYDRTCPILLVDAATFAELPPTLPAPLPEDTP
jgi:predicted aconitase with swiveling domain